MAKTPIKQTYSAPFITKAVVIMFTLLSSELNRAYGIDIVQGACRRNTFEQAMLNQLKC